MIRSTTYRDQVEFRRDLLAAYSAFDHRTTAALDPNQLEGEYRQLLLRLSALVSLHGARAPRQFLQALASGSYDGAEVGLTASFLEHGRAPAEADRPDVSELQQELVHFARIVDIGTVGFEPGAGGTIKRLRSSRRIPGRLKVLCEFMIVTRSRLIARGARLVRPEPPAGNVVEDCLDKQTTLATPDRHVNHVLMLVSPRRRKRREISYLFHTLKAYLTPRDAAYAIWANVQAEQPREIVELLLVTVAEGRAVKTLCWSYRPEQRTDDVLGQCLGALPREAEYAYPSRVQLDVGQQRVTIAPTAHGWTFATLSAGTEPTRIVELSDQGRTLASPAIMVQQARLTMVDYVGPPVSTIECGHIHLDRDPDIDQETSVKIGAALLGDLAGRQPQAPVLTPLIDDDHVLVRLSPTRYQDFLRAHVGELPVRLIPESSPVIGAIAAVLFGRLQRGGSGQRLRLRGGNLFLDLGAGDYCELYEDFQHAPVTGCVFFETALLVYRTAPKRFDDYFIRRFGLSEGVHERVHAILDIDMPHDEKTDLLQGYYRTFSVVTTPLTADVEVAELAADVLASRKEPVVHLNVLEDYYQSQQHKVRKLIDLLSLPVDLLTVHFNVQTGRVTFER